MSVQQMRDILKRQYNGSSKWVDRVNKMEDAQIIAIYHRMRSSGQLKH